MPVKATFTLDDATIRQLDEAATRLARPKSEIVRESIAGFYERLGKLTERERVAMLHAFDTLMPQAARRSPAEVAAEISDIRAARRSGGRRSGAGQSHDRS